MYDFDTATLVLAQDQTPPPPGAGAIPPPPGGGQPLTGATPAGGGDGRYQTQQSVRVCFGRYAGGGGEWRCGGRSGERFRIGTRHEPTGRRGHR